MSDNRFSGVHKGAAFPEAAERTTAEAALDLATQQCAVKLFLVNPLNVASL